MLVYCAYGKFYLPVSCRGSIQSVHTRPHRRVSTPLPPSANNQREYFYRWFSVSVRQNDTLAETGGARFPYHYSTMECPCPDQNLTCPYLHAVIHRFENYHPHCFLRITSGCRFSRNLNENEAMSVSNGCAPSWYLRTNQVGTIQPSLKATVSKPDSTSR